MENYKNNTLSETENTASAGNMSKEDTFSKLIHGEYREQFQNKFDKEFSRRFKNMKKTEEELERLKEALLPLTERYGEKDVTALVKRLVSSTKEIEDKKGRLDEYVKNQYAAWDKEATELAKEYPGFDIKTELKAPHFCAGLKSGIPMSYLYRGMHFDELSKDISDAAAKAAVENIRSGYGRIKEAGSENSAPVKKRKKVEDLTGEEIENIIDRVRRGEKISFGA